MVEEIDVTSWEEFEERLEKLRDESKSADGTESELWFRGQENSCWPLSTTLDQKIQGTALFSDYYLLASRVRPQIESFTGRNWEIPAYTDVLTH